jgi:tRNA pseudouridine32 synthase / 23S rRNA pseudouridine746 synthase
MFVSFEHQPADSELPTVFPTPFRAGLPHALAALATLQMQTYVESHPALRSDTFWGQLGGQMLGVLVVRRRDGCVGYLRGFAGQLDGRWLAEGFVPPVFDVEQFEALWAEGGARISDLDREIKTLRACARSEAESKRLTEAALAQKEVSRKLHAELHDTYRFFNSHNQSATLREFFAPKLPPGGAGDCAGPKLLARAFSLGVQPLALAEFWWGGQPPAGDRQHGAYYPACTKRCATILPFMLEGIPCETAPTLE